MLKDTRCCSTFDSRLISSSVTQKWKKMVNKWDGNGPGDFHKASCDLRRQSDKVERAWRTIARHARQRGTISHGNERFKIVIFSCSFLRLPFKELSLQVSESESQISIWLYSHTTELLSRYVHYFSLLLLYQFLGVFTSQDSARSAQVLYLPYSAPIGARSLLHCYIHPFGLNKCSMQPAQTPKP